MNATVHFAKVKERQKAWVISLLFLLIFLCFWQLSTKPSVGGKTEGLPGPFAVAQRAWEMVSDPFYDRGAKR